jgi:hypothetical protein
MNSEVHQSPCKYSPNLLRDIWVKVTLSARPLLTPVDRHCIIHEQNVCSFANITSHRNRLPLCVKHLATRILTGNHWRGRQYTTSKGMPGHRKRLSMTSDCRATEQLKLRPYRFQAVHQLQQRDTAAQTQYCQWFRSFVRQSVRVW